MARRLGRLFVDVDANTQPYVRGLRSAERAQRRFNEGVRNLSTRINRFNRIARNLPRNLLRQRNALLALAGAGGIGLVVREYTRAADALTNIQSRLSIVTDSTEELASVQDRLFQIAQDTRGSFQGIASSYARMAAAGRAAGVSTEELLRVQRLLSQAFIISGSTAQEATAASIQFAQALGSNRFSGDELRSFLEQSLRGSQALAAGLGVTIGQLRELGEAGELTTSTVIAALSSQAQAVAEDFANIRTTVGQAFEQLRNDLLRVVGIISDSSDSTDVLVNAIQRLRAVVTDRENIEAFTAAIGNVVSLLAWVVENSENIVRALRGIATAFITFTTAVTFVFPLFRLAAWAQSVFRATSATRQMAAATARARASTDGLSRSANVGRQEVRAFSNAAERAEKASDALSNTALRADSNLVALGLAGAGAAGLIAASWEEAEVRVADSIEGQVEQLQRLADEYGVVYDETQRRGEDLAEQQRALVEQARQFRDFAFSGEDIFGAMAGLAGVVEEGDAIRNQERLNNITKLYTIEITRYRDTQIRLNREAAEAARLAAIERDREFGKFLTFTGDLEAASRRRVQLEAQILDSTRLGTAAVAAREQATLRMEQRTRALVVEAGTDARHQERINELLSFRDDIAGRRLRLEQQITAAAARRATLQERLHRLYVEGDLRSAEQLKTQLASAIIAEEQANEQLRVYEAQVPILREMQSLDAQRRQDVREYNAEVERSADLLDEQRAAIVRAATAAPAETLTISDTSLADLERQLVVVNRARRDREATNQVLQSQAELVERIDVIQREAEQQRLIAVQTELALQNARLDAQRGVIVLTQEEINLFEEQIDAANRSARELDLLAEQRQNNLANDLERVRENGEATKQALEELAELQAIDRLRDNIVSASRQFTNSILTDIDNIGEAFKRLGRTVIEAIFDQLVARRLANALGGALDRFFFPAGGGATSGGFDFAFQSGGRFGPGQVGIVGERGPEILATGGSSGRVFSNTESRGLLGGSSVVINYSPTIQGSDEQTVRRVLQEDRPRLKQEISQGVIQDMNRPSSMSRTFQRR